jgi:hypothetical protein
MTGSYLLLFCERGYVNIWKQSAVDIHDHLLVFLLYLFTYAHVPSILCFHGIFLSS